MNPEKIYKLKINKKQRENLPVFYNFIIYNYPNNKLLPHYHFDEKLQCYQNYYLPSKLISKIDFDE